jgi:hypothetical protein
MTMRPTTILIAEDQGMMRSALASTSSKTW